MGKSGTFVVLHDAGDSIDEYTVRWDEGSPAPRNLTDSIPALRYVILDFQDQLERRLRGKNGNYRLLEDETVTFTCEDPNEPIR